MTDTLHWTFGKAAVHRVIDIDVFPIPLGILFPTADAQLLGPFRDLLAQGHFDFDGGAVLLAIQSHLIRLAGQTILIDTCVGEHKARPRRPEWNRRAGTRYLANLAAAGVTPDDVDIVMCTHLHADHVGWNTCLRSGQWVPTFPKARYVMCQREIDHRAHEAARSPDADHGSFRDSVLPVLDRGLATPKQGGDEIVEGATIVDLPGHAPGQIGLEITAGAGPRMVFCGDAIHSPLQVLRNWSSGFCFDAAQAARTRRGCWSALGR